VPRSPSAGSIHTREQAGLLAALEPAGQAGVPQLMADPHPRVVVLPIDLELLGWYSRIGGPPAIGWTGGEADAVRAALDALPARAAFCRLLKNQETPSLSHGDLDGRGRAADYAHR
jgi:hypothetical protein